MYWVPSNVEYMKYDLVLGRKPIACTCMCRYCKRVGANTQRKRLSVKFVNSFWAFSLLQADIDGEVEKVLCKDGGLCFLFSWHFLVNLSLWWRFRFLARTMRTPHYNFLNFNEPLYPAAKAMRNTRTNRENISYFQNVITKGAGNHHYYDFLPEGSWLLFFYLQSPLVMEIV